MHTISVTISGLEPGLMMNSLKIANFISGSVIPDEIKKKGIKDLRGWYEAEPESARGWEAERGSYRMTNGPTKDGKPDGKTALCIPQDVLWGCFTRACSNFKVKISGKMRPASNVFPSILRLKEFEVPLVDKDGKLIFNFNQMVTKFVRIPPRTGARVMKSWGVIFPWNANFTFNASGKSSNDVLSIAKEVLVSGGQLQGLMEGRPGLRHFGYGQFDVTKWEVKDVGDTVLDKVEIGEEEEAASA